MPLHPSFVSVFFTLTTPPLESESHISLMQNK